MRHTYSLNNGWQFTEATSNNEQNIDTSPSVDLINLPHTWNNKNNNDKNKGNEIKEYPYQFVANFHSSNS